MVAFNHLLWNSYKYSYIKCNMLPEYLVFRAYSSKHWNKLNIFEIYFKYFWYWKISS